MPHNFDIAFMPYSSIDTSIVLGDYEIHPFYNVADQMIEIENVLEQVEKYFSRYFEYKYDRVKKVGGDEKLRTITIIIPKNFKIGVDELSYDQKIDIYSLSHIISFSSIFETELGFSTSDPFKIYIQSFVSGKEGLFIYGKYFTKYELYKFQKPLYIQNQIIPFYKTPLCECLASSLQYRDTLPIISRIFRSLELMFYTVTFEEMNTDEYKLISLLMSFEILLDYKNKAEFVKEIEK